jgi:DNA-binding CsgD family transcriptional regulator
MPGGGGDHKSGRATFDARAREMNVLQLHLRGVTFEQIGQQLGIDKSTAAKAWHRVLKRLPAADVEAMRKAQGERIDLMRQKIWAEISGRRDASGKVVPPTTDQIYEGIDRALKIERHAALLFGLDAPTKSAIVSVVAGQAVSDEELDIRLARLTPEEQETFMKLVAKMEGRWVEPAAIEEGSIETTATPL